MIDMNLEWTSAFAAIIALIALIFNIYFRYKHILHNDLKHIHIRINEVEDTITDVRERLSGLERDVTWLKTGK